jgi:hypothetical protein
MQMVSRRRVPWYQRPDTIRHDNVYPDECQGICLPDKECQCIFLPDVAHDFRTQNVMINGVQTAPPTAPGGQM